MDDYPMYVSPVSDYEAYAATHSEMYDVAPEGILAISGDDTTRNFYPLPRTSVVGETSLWEKVSKK